MYDRKRHSVVVISIRTFVVWAVAYFVLVHFVIILALGSVQKIQFKIQERPKEKVQFKQLGEPGYRNSNFDCQIDVSHNRGKREA